MQAAAEEARAAGKSIGFVPTMGALHEGHLSLVRRARKECDTVVVSVFVNPVQFGPNEDYLNYPRDPERDSKLLEEEGVDFLFTPSAEEMYPEGPQTSIDVGSVARPLEGEFRPGHFAGVATVVKKLFDATLPDKAYFGQKDAQQCAVVRQLTRDFNLPVEIVVCPIVREQDGLAMSSRNAYMNEEEREAALVLSRSLRRARELLEGGESSVAAIEAAMRAVLEAEPLAKIDYAAVVDAATFQPVKKVEKDAVCALAVWIGRARLLDNLTIGFEGGKIVCRL